MCKRERKRFEGCERGNVYCFGTRLSAAFLAVITSDTAPNIPFWAGYRPESAGQILIGELQIESTDQIPTSSFPNFKVHSVISQHMYKITEFRSPLTLRDIV